MVLLVVKKVIKKVSKKVKKVKNLVNAQSKSSIINNVKASVTRTDLLGDIVSKYPEVVPVLAQAGLHCIGCHVSVSESIEDGCSVHGMNSKEIDELINNVNKRISEVEKLPKVTFTKETILELIKRKETSKKKYVRIVNSFGGEFDFDTTDTIEDNDVKVNVVNSNASVEVLLFSPIERMLRGIEIDYNLKLKDFTAKRK